MPGKAAALLTEPLPTSATDLPAATFRSGTLPPIKPAQRGGRDIPKRHVAAFPQKVFPSPPAGKVPHNRQGAERDPATFRSGTSPPPKFFIPFGK